MTDPAEQIRQLIEKGQTLEAVRAGRQLTCTVYQHGGGRMFIDGEAGQRELFIDGYEPAATDYFFAVAPEVLLPILSAYADLLAARSSEALQAEPFARTWNDAAGRMLPDTPSPTAETSTWVCPTCQDARCGGETAVVASPWTAETPTIHRSRCSHCGGPIYRLGNGAPTETHEQWCKVLKAPAVAASPGTADTLKLVAELDDLWHAWAGTKEVGTRADEDRAFTQFARTAALKWHALASAIKQQPAPSEDQAKARAWDRLRVTVATYAGGQMAMPLCAAEMGMLLRESTVPAPAATPTPTPDDRADYHHGQ